MKYLVLLLSFFTSIVFAQSKELVIYTSWEQQTLDTIISDFQNETGIKVTVWRAATPYVVTKVIAESILPDPFVDVIMLPNIEMAQLDTRYLFADPRLTQETLSKLDPRATTPRQNWVIARFTPNVLAYNPKLIKKADLPKSYYDLLNPRFKGQLGVESRSEEWFASVLMYYGEGEGLRLMQRIVKTNGMSPRSGNYALVHLVAKGEVPIALTTQINKVQTSKEQGHSVDWIALAPTTATGMSAGIANAAPNSANARLFLEYMLSKRTQQKLAGLNFVPVHKEVKSPFPNLKYTVIDANLFLPRQQEWYELFTKTMVTFPREKL